MRLWLIALLHLAACGGTRMQVQVESPSGGPQAGAYVNLVSAHEICARGSSHVTDARGTVQVAKEYCGELGLIVGASGYGTSYRTLDTCGRAYVRVRLREAPAPSEPTDACSLSAERFLHAWVNRGLDAAEFFLGKAVAEAHRREPSASVPWRIAIDSHRMRGEVCIVDARMSYAAGCVERWRVMLRQVDDTFRVSDLVQGPYAR